MLSYCLHKGPMDGVNSMDTNTSLTRFKYEVENEG